ncbi:MAG: abortive infection system AbiD/AbiF-like protein [Candidatus Malacoplasma girerdii]|nr:MAG: abortive infection system AbiD/AbiF-like protein [Candidatus Malacoplasma girerdii]
MRYIIDRKKIIKCLVKTGLTIDDEKRLIQAINHYNFNTLINGYSHIFLKKDKVNRYEKEASSNQIIDFYEFDLNFANHLLRYILKLEKQLNTAVAYCLIDVYQLHDHCLMKLNPQYIKEKILVNLDTVNPPISFDNFMNALVKHCAINDLTKAYKVKGTSDIYRMWSELPLDLMCVTWSFATTFNLFISLNSSLIDYIGEQFNVISRNTNGFIDFIHNLLIIRNKISHNYVIYNTQIEYQSNALNNLYNELFKVQVKHIGFYELLQMIEYFVNDYSIIKKTKMYFDKLKIKDQFKRRIMLFGVNNEN